MTREDLDKRKVALLAYIHDAFKGVTREGGVSWHEAGEIGSRHNPTAQQLVQARVFDTEASWTELSGDFKWDPHESWGNSCFHYLDPIGFRYYLPAAMVLCIKHGCDRGLRAHLTARSGNGADGKPNEQWCALNRRQSLCVRAFLQYMIDVATLASSPLERDWWKDALDSHWGKL